MAMARCRLQPPLLLLLVVVLAVFGMAAVVEAKAVRLSE